MVRLRDEVRLAPVTLVTSQEVRLQRIERRGVIRGSQLFVPAPPTDVVASLLAFLRRMWPPDDE